MLEDKIMEQAEHRLRDAGIEAFKTLVYEGDPAERILAAARDQHVDAIFVGDRGLGALHRLIMGSVAHKVVNLCTCICVIGK